MGGAGDTWRWTHKVIQVCRWSLVTLNHPKIRASLELALLHPVGPLSIITTPDGRELRGDESRAQKKHAQERQKEESLETFGQDTYKGCQVGNQSGFQMESRPLITTSSFFEVFYETQQNLIRLCCCKWKCHWLASVQTQKNQERLFGFFSHMHLCSCTLKMHYLRIQRNTVLFSHFFTQNSQDGRYQWPASTLKVTRMVTDEPGTQFFNSITSGSEICCREELIFKKAQNL